MYREDILKAAIELAKARLSASTPAANPSSIIEDAYDKITEIASRDGILQEDD